MKINEKNIFYELECTLKKNPSDIEQNKTEYLKIKVLCGRAIQFNIDVIGGFECFFNVSPKLPSRFQNQWNFFFRSLFVPMRPCTIWCKYTNFVA